MNKPEIIRKKQDRSKISNIHSIYIYTLYKFKKIKDI